MTDLLSLPGASLDLLRLWWTHLALLYQVAIVTELEIAPLEVTIITLLVKYVVPGTETTRKFAAEFTDEEWELAIQEAALYVRARLQKVRAERAQDAFLARLEQREASEVARDLEEMANARGGPT